MSTISLMMCRGVRNCPFCPADAIFPSMYSYRSPFVSRFSIGIVSSMSTTFDSSAGVGMVNRASFMWSEYVESSPPTCSPYFCRNGKTCVATVWYMTSASRFLNRLHRRWS